MGRSKKKQPASQALTSSAPVGPEQGSNVVASVPHTEQSLHKDALSYVDQVRARYMYRPQIFNLFLADMNGFKNQMVDIPGLIENISALFVDSPDLVHGFQAFLPPEYQMASGVYQVKSESQLRSEAKILESRSPPVTNINFADAYSYVYQIKTQTSHEPRLYREFLVAMYDCYTGNVPLPELRNVMNSLFSDYPELIQGFNIFFPFMSSEIEFSRASKL